jgi:hypothetical protein
MSGLADTSVGALVYRVTDQRIGVTWLPPDGGREHLWLATTSAVIPMIDDLRDEVSNGMALARNRVPHLRAFADGWDGTWYRDRCSTRRRTARPVDPRGCPVLASAA